MKWATWDEAAIASAASVLSAFVLTKLPTNRLFRFAIPALREFAFVAGLYSIWRVARMLPLTQDEGAIERARTINDWQQALYMPSEISVQHAVIGHDWLARFVTWYYAVIHVPSIIIFLICLYVFRNEFYKRWRTALVILTGFCLVIRFWRVAPPRFVPELGFVKLSDTYGLDVYGPVGTGVSDQFAAMPSIHIAWAAVITFGFVAATTSRWRYLAHIHLALTFFVVAATGHHWWLDGIVAIGLLGVGLAMDSGGRALGRRWRNEGAPQRSSDGAGLVTDDPDRLPASGREVGAGGLEPVSPNSDDDECSNTPEEATLS